MIVSMFFQLPQETTSVRPVSFYVDHGRKTLELPYPLTLFCDATTRPFLESVRGSRPTHYIEKSLLDYDFVKDLLPIIQKNRNGRECYTNSRNIPLYFLLCMFKVYALYQTSLRFPDTTYVWVDLGGSHVARNFTDGLSAIVANPRPKIACCYIHYRSKQELYPMESYLQYGGPCAIACGVFSVEHGYVARLYSAMFGIMYEQISRGVGHCDEQCMIYVYDQHPDWFSLYFGDYYSTITNYHSSVEDIATIDRFFITNAERDGRHDLAMLARNN